MTNAATHSTVAPSTSKPRITAGERAGIPPRRMDFEFAEEHAAKVGKNCELFLQPEWSRKEKMTELIVDYVMKNPKWKISLQTHKYLNIP